VSLASFVDVVPPVWVVVALLGAIWGSAWAVLRPPPARTFPAQFLGGVLGAAIGQFMGNGFGLNDQLLGDVHVFAVSVGACVVVVVVRRMVA
jgi:uncharacterized membrane protein YeaQ/YmgE (transglycosylase-associated protein family)